MLVYPAKQDIVLAGPGEGWKVDGDGEMIGVTTGRPVMLLDDLARGLADGRTARQAAISCSIDPTAEGLTQLPAFVKKIKGPPANTSNGQRHRDDARPAGDQRHRRAGQQPLRPRDGGGRLPDEASGNELRAVAGQRLPSFLDMMKAGPRGMSNMLPRWWLAPNYDPLLASPDGLALEIRGGGVKAMTEEDFLTETGGREHTGKANPVAKKWADNMTAQYDELSRWPSIFGQLRNCMELAIVGA